MINNESNLFPLIKISNFKKKEISNPKIFFHLIYTFYNKDYLFESLQYTKDLKIKYEIRKQHSNKEEFETKLSFELNLYNAYSLINDLFIVKYEEYINIYKFIKDNTDYYLKQQIIIEPIKPSICYNGFLMKIIKQNKQYNNNNEIIDILIQPNRNIKNYFRIYRTDENNNFNFHKKILINDGDDPGFIFVNEKNNKLFSFIEKATDDKNKDSKSYILNYNLFNYEKINYIEIKDLKQFNSNYGYRQELKIYQNSFLFIHNKNIRIFSIDELNRNYFQIVNIQKIKLYQCSAISHIDNSLFIAQSNNIKGDKSYIKQYILEKDSLELTEIDSIEINGFIEDIFNYINGYIIKYINSNNDAKYILLYKENNKIIQKT